MIRKMSELDYAMTSEWWQAHIGRALPRACVSDYGFLYVLDSKPIACMFLFPVQGCKMAMLGWPIANPESSSTERDVAFPLLINFIEDEARELGYDWLTTYSSRPSVSKRFESAEFLVGDSPVTQYVKYLGV